ILVATLLPGRQLARGSALVGAAGVLLLDEMAVPWWVRGAWGVLWLAIAWQSGLPERPDLQPSPPRRRALEAGAVALPLGLALLATGLGITIVTRIADGRERYAGSVFVSDAHELQD